MPSLGRFASADTIIPTPGNPQSFNRYSYTFNNPLKYTDPTGHCPWCIVIGGAILIAKGIDYGWTAYDIWQAGQTLENPYASSEDKLIAGLNIALAITFEAIEPDDLLPIGVPADDLARRGIIAGFKEAIGQGGLKAGVGLIKDALGSQAPTAIRHMYDKGLFRDIMRYGEWDNILSGVRQGAGLEVHHIVEQRFAQTLGLNSTEMLSVVLTKEQHDMFTRAWSQRIGLNNWTSYANRTSTVGKNEIWAAAQDIYKDYPELLEAARKTIWGE